MKASSTSQPARLTDVLIKAIADRLDRTIYRPGDRLPSENALCKEFGVSRTVVREAVASMRQSGRLVSKPGIGVFVVEDPDPTIEFSIDASGESRWALHIMELRMAIEVESAGLAAERRTPQDLTDIVQAFDSFMAADVNMPAAIEADIAFHFAIARASHNPHFVKILVSSVNEVTADLKIKHGGRTEQGMREYEKRTAREHGAILSAITRRDTSGARTAMTRHLADSIARYRLMLSKAQ